MCKITKTNRAVLIALAALLSVPSFGSSAAECESLFSKEDWSRALQCTHELPITLPEYRKLRVRTAIALFEKRLPLAALTVIGDLKGGKSKDELTENETRLLELAALFQKKVPAPLLPSSLEQANLSHVPSYLEDEVRYAKARFALSKGDTKAAATHFTEIQSHSRYFPLSRYHLAAIALREDNTALAEKYLVGLYSSQVMTQPSEVWQQMVTQFTLHWGPSFHVALDADRILKSQELGELGTLAFARLAYAKKDFGIALQHYDKIQIGSRFRATAQLERIWTLIQLNRQEEGQKAAVELAKYSTSFESYKAEPLAALILTETQKTDEARRVLELFDNRIADLKETLKQYIAAPRTVKLPTSLLADMKGSELRETLDRFEADLQTELNELNSDTMRPYPAFQKLALRLSNWKNFAAEERIKLQVTFAKNQLNAVPAILRQSKLMLAETYLEDREILRREFMARADRNQPEIQKLHDLRLATLIEKVLSVIETSFPKVKSRPNNLEFRQVELMWELASAKMILAQSENKPSYTAEALTLRKQAISTMTRLLNENPKFPKRADALFFKGFAELELQRQDEGLKTLSLFLKDYPEHEHAPDAYRILGDDRFESADYQAAANYFQQIVAFSDSPIVGYAYYKAGWSWYYLRNSPNALKNLELAMRWAGVAGLQTSTFNLTRESSRDYIAIFAENETVEKAFAEFPRLFTGDALKEALWDFARELDKNGEFAAASKVYEKLYAQSTSAKEKLTLQSHLFYDLYRLRRWQEIEHDITSTPNDGSPYLGEGKEDIEPRLREIAMGQHFEFQKEVTPAALNSMEIFDRHYLRLFGQESSAQPVHYELGLLLLNRKQYQPAIDQLQLHWQAYKATLKEPLKEQALRNLLFALERKESKGEEKALSANAEMLLSLSTEYQTLYSKNANARVVASLRPSIFYKYARNEKGMMESEKLVLENANDKIGIKAFQDLRVAHFQGKEWQKTVAWCDSKLIDEKMASRRKELISLRGEALFFWAETLGETDAAAQKFETIAADPRHGELRDKSAFRAFALYEKLNRRKDASRTLETYLGQARPAAELNSWTSLGAVLYQDAGDFEKAHGLWKKYLTLPGAEKEKELYLQAKWNLARITYAAGNRRLASEMMVELQTESKNNPAQAKQVTAWLEKQKAVVRREPASTRQWKELVAARSQFEKMGLPKSAKPTERIAAGSKEMAALVKQFVDFSKTAEAENYHRIEAACSIPVLYQALSKKITLLAKGMSEKAKENVVKIVQPIDEKAKELARPCIDDGEISIHSGPAFEAIRKQFAGVGRNEAEKWAGLIERLGDPRLLLGITPTASEKEILGLHFEGRASDESWQNLTASRFINSQWGMAELTAEETLRRYPKLPLPYGVLGYAAFSRGASDEALALFEKAAQLGWSQAPLGNVLYYGRQHRYGLARTALRRSLDKGAFAGFAETENLARELAKE